jgi:hypothetical protein
MPFLLPLPLPLALALPLPLPFWIAIFFAAITWQAEKNEYK